MRKIIIIALFALFIGSIISSCGMSREICPAYTESDEVIENQDASDDLKSEEG